MLPMLYLLDIYSCCWLGSMWKQDMEPMLKVKTTLVNVPVDIPQEEVN
jgi:hypothetical protein